MNDRAHVVVPDGPGWYADRPRLDQPAMSRGQITLWLKEWRRAHCRNTRSRPYSVAWAPRWHWRAPCVRKSWPAPRATPREPRAKGRRHAGWVREERPAPSGANRVPHGAGMGVFKRYRAGANSARLVQARVLKRVSRRVRLPAPPPIFSFSLDSLTSAGVSRVEKPAPTPVTRIGTTWLCGSRRSLSFATSSQRDAHG